MLETARTALERGRLALSRVNAMSARLGEPSYRVAFRAARLRLREGYGLDEADEYGLLASDRRTTPLASKRAAAEARATLNPPWMRPLLDDKALFAQRCDALGLPCAATLAVYSGKRTGVLGDGRILASRDDWRAALDSELPDEFVVKPSGGGFGRGVRLVRRRGGTFFADGPIGDADALLELLDREGGGSAWLMQERLRNHPGIEELSGAEGLQTVRVTTLLRGGEAEPLFSFFKLIGDGGAVHDNYQGGRSGNLIAQVDLARGELGLVLGAAGRETERHPVTGRVLPGVRIPEHSALMDLARRAALGFAPARTIGWDVAVTPEGPVLVEGNWDWHFIVRMPGNPEALATLVDAARAARDGSD